MEERLNEQEVQHNAETVRPTWGWDPLSLAVSAIHYWDSAQELCPYLEFTFYVDRHPCNDEAYMADLWFSTYAVEIPMGEQFDGEGA